MKDAIDKFKEFIGKTDDDIIIKEALLSIEYPDKKKVKEQFDLLIKDIQDTEKSITIRAYGRGGKNGKREK